MDEDKARALAVDLSVIAVRLVRWLRAADEAPTLSGPEASAMAVIVHSGGISPSDLARLEQVRRPTITRVVDSLVARGLVERSRHPGDLRAFVVAATAEGRALWLAGQLRRVEPLAERISRLEVREVRELERMMPILASILAPPARSTC